MPILPPPARNPQPAPFTAAEELQLALSRGASRSALNQALLRIIEDAKAVHSSIGRMERLAEGIYVHFLDADAEISRRTIAMMEKSHAAKDRRRVKRRLERNAVVAPPAAPAVGDEG